MVCLLGFQQCDTFHADGKGSAVRLPDGFENNRQLFLIKHGLLFGQNGGFIGFRKRKKCFIMVIMMIEVKEMERRNEKEAN